MPDQHLGFCSEALSSFTCRWTNALRLGFALPLAIAPLAHAQELTLHGHDALNRLVQSERSDGSAFIFEYDAAGNVRTIRRQSVPTDADLLLHLPFDDCTATNTVIGGVAPVTSGAPTCVPGKSGQALHFEQGDRLSAWVDARFSSPNITIAAWIRPTGSGDHNPRLAGVGPAGTSGQYYSLILEGTQTERSIWACCYGGASTISEGKVATGGPWRHVAVTFEGQRAALYIDGVLDTVNPTYTPLNGFSSALLQVAYSDNGLDQFVGDLDGLRIYRRALNSAELASLWQQGR